MARLKDDDEGAAKTGVTETTTEAAKYPHPTNSKITFWDLPGIGRYVPDVRLIIHQRKGPFIIQEGVWASWIGEGGGGLR
jgi:hypothetical protein